MRQELLQQYIYNETLLSRLYRQVATKAPSSKERDAYLQFAAEASANAEKLNQIYRDEYGTGFNPIVPDTVLQGGYRELVVELLDVELTSMTELRKHTYFQQDFRINETFRQIADGKFDNIVILLSILENYNNIQIQELKRMMEEYN